jgi:hypothetical protein
MGAQQGKDVRTSTKGKAKPPPLGKDSPRFMPSPAAIGSGNIFTEHSGELQLNQLSFLSCKSLSAFTIDQMFIVQNIIVLKGKGFSHYSVGMNDWHDIACLSRLKKKKKKFTHWQYLTNN